MTELNSLKYEKHLLNVSTYQKENPEKCKIKSKKWNDKLKLENPEKYNEMLEKKKKYYLEVRKPKMLLEKSKLDILKSNI